MVSHCYFINQQNMMYHLILTYVLNMEFGFGAENLIQGLLHPLVTRSAIGSVFAFLSARVNFSATRQS